MALFQKSVTNKYLLNLDTDEIERVFLSFRGFLRTAKRGQELSALSVLNSKILKFYYEMNFNLGMNLTTRLAIEYLKLLPVLKTEKQQVEVLGEKAGQMLLLNNVLQTKATKFIKRIKANLGVLKITKKIENFYDYDFKTFILELKKQKIKPEFKAQYQWEGYFDSYKEEINQLQNQINQTDKQIDRVIYKLYQLSPEEINIVESTIVKN